MAERGTLVGSVAEEVSRRMKPHEPAVPAHQRVSGDTADQLPGGWHAHLIDFDGPSFLEHDRGRVAEPHVLSARWALELGSRLFKRRYCSIEVVLTAVPFHGESLSGMTDPDDQ
jgi:hypothetical protein